MPTDNSEFIKRIKKIIMSGDGAGHFEILAHKSWPRPSQDVISHLFKDGVESGMAAKAEFN